MADRSNVRRTTKTPASKTRKRRNTFAVFYVITMIIGVVVCVTLFALAYQTLVPDRIMTGNSPSDTENTPVVFERPEQERELGMISSINSLHRTLTLHLLDSGRTDRFYMTDSTPVQDRRGNPIGFGELDLGDIIEVTFDVHSRDLAAVNESGRAWREQHRGNFDINLEAGTITIGNRVYTYSSRTMVLNRGEDFSIVMINPEDAITLVGYGDKIWSIRVDSGHGFIRFENAEQVVNGTVTIGNTSFYTLEDSRPISVIEGTHRVIVNGQNIETFVADVVVRQNQTVNIDLMSDIQLRHGRLQLIINEPNAVVLIDGEPVEETLVELEFGTYVLRVEAPGFIPIQQEVELVQDFMRLELDLVRDISGAQILIETFPSDAQIFLDDAFVGNSPVTVEVEFGTRSIIARRAGYEDRPLHIMVDENSPRQYMLTMMQLPMHPPIGLPPAPTDDGHYLPGPGPGVTPIPSPVIHPDWPQQQLPAQPIPQPVQPQAPPPPPPPPLPSPPDDTGWDWPSVNDLPVPPGYPHINWDEVY